MNFRSVLLLLILTAFTIFIVTRFADAEHLLQTLAQGDWRWVAAATLTHLGFFVLYALLYQFALKAVGVKSRMADLVPLVFASVMVNSIAPSAGAGQAALFIDDAARRGQSGARAAVGSVLVLLVDLATLLPFILFGLLYLRGKGALRPYDVAGAGIFLVYVLALVGAILLAWWRPAWLRAILRRLQSISVRVTARLKRKPLFVDGWVDETVRELRDGAEAVFTRPVPVGQACLAGLAMHVVNIAGFYMLFPAFHQRVDVGTLVTGFAMGIIFWVVVIVPQGAGLSEGVMALVFTDAGVPSAQAVVVALAFRGLNSWLPLAIGALFLRRARTFRTRSRSRDRASAE